MLQLAIGEFERWRVERISRGRRGWFMQESGEHIRRAQCAWDHHRFCKVTVRLALVDREKKARNMLQLQDKDSPLGYSELGLYKKEFFCAPHDLHNLS
jgi:hypothetical protein